MESHGGRPAAARGHHHHAAAAPAPDARLGRRFALGVGLNLAFVAVEVVWGLRAHSLALLADAGHNLSDVLGLLLSWAAWIAARAAPAGRRTYGFRRGSILAALFNALLLLLAVGAIGWEAIGRFRQPAPVAGGIVMAVAGIGILVNAASALLFAAGRERDLNVRSAFLHLVADAAVSLGVVVAGLAIARTGLAWIDPAVSLAVALVILAGTWGLLRESLDLALDAVPRGIDVGAVEAHLAALPGVETVHDLHVWGLSTTEAALTAHLVMPQAPCDDAFHRALARDLHDRFGIEHVTVQVERCGDGCAQEPAGTL